MDSNTIPRSDLNITSENSTPIQLNTLLAFLETKEGNQPVPLRISTSECVHTEIVYLPVRIVKSLIVKHSVHPSEQLIVSLKLRDGTRKVGFREELHLFTRAQLSEENVDIDLLLKEDVIYVDQQIVWLSRFSKFGNKVAEIFELQELTRKARVVSEVTSGE